MILFKWGESYLPAENLEDGVWVTDTILTSTIGLKTGDKIISINGDQPERFTQIIRKLLKHGSMVVERDGKEITLNIPRKMPGILSENSIKSKKSLLSFRYPWIYYEAIDTSINKNAGLERFDQIVGVNGNSHYYFDEFVPYIDTLKGKSATFQVKRNGDTLNIELKVSKAGKLEIFNTPPSTLDSLGYLGLIHVEYGFFEAIPAGFKYARKQLTDYIDDFKLILDVKSGAHKGMGGFAAIGGLFPSKWNWQNFWGITAFLSLMLAFLNVLPIPALDGGHVMFLLYEMITGRKPGEKFMEYAQIVGMIVLLFLLLYANGNDIYRFFAGR